MDMRTFGLLLFLTIHLTILQVRCSPISRTTTLTPPKMHGNAANDDGRQLLRNEVWTRGIPHTHSSPIMITCNREVCVSQDQRQYACNAAKPHNDQTLLLMFAEREDDVTSVARYTASIPKSEGTAIPVEWTSTHNDIVPTTCVRLVATTRVSSAASDQSSSNDPAGTMLETDAPTDGEGSPNGGRVGATDLGGLPPIQAIGSPFGICCEACPILNEDTPASLSCCKGCSFL